MHGADEGDEKRAAGGEGLVDCLLLGQVITR
jgi:hypothetical protein